MSRCRTITLKDGSTVRAQTENGDLLPANDIEQVEKFVAYVKARKRRSPTTKQNKEKN